MVHVGKYAIHGACGILITYNSSFIDSCLFLFNSANETFTNENCVILFASLHPTIAVEEILLRKTGGFLAG